MKDTKKPTHKSMSAQKGKAEDSKAKKGREVALDETMDARVCALFTDPGVKQSVKDGLDRLISKLEKTLFDASSMPAIPETAIAGYMAVSNAYLYEQQRGVLTDEARAVAATLAEYVERREPESHKLARRVSELINSGLDGRDEVEDWFAQLTNDVGVSLNDAEFCAAAFVRAAARVEGTKPVRRITRKNVRLLGAQKAYERLKEIVRRVDAGESLAQIRDEWQASLKAGNAPQGSRPKGKR